MENLTFRTKICSILLSLAIIALSIFNIISGIFTIQSNDVFAIVSGCIGISCTLIIMLVIMAYANAFKFKLKGQPYYIPSWLLFVTLAEFSVFEFLPPFMAICSNGFVSSALSWIICILFLLVLLSNIGIVLFRNNSRLKMLIYLGDALLLLIAYILILVRTISYGSLNAMSYISPIIGIVLAIALGGTGYFGTLDKPEDNYKVPINIY